MAKKKKERKSLLDADLGMLQEEDPVVARLLEPVVEGAPAPTAPTRDRSWDREHPVLVVWIPERSRKKRDDLWEQLKKQVEALNAALRQRGLAETTLGAVVATLMDFAWHEYQQGRLNLVALLPPSPRHRQPVAWRRADASGEEEVLHPVARGRADPVRREKKYLSVRLPPDQVPVWQERLRQAAGGDLSTGEVLLAFVEYGLEAWRKGEITLVPPA